MTIEHFFIDGVRLEAELTSTSDSTSKLNVLSVPRPYSIEWLNPDIPIETLINEDPNAILFADSYIAETWLTNIADHVPSFFVKALETEKNVFTAIDFAEFMESIGTTKGNMVYVVGGGIMQDLGAFSCAMYKRGIPWTYIPTTLLGMTDSCIGGKTGLNHKTTKNLFALFSAPKRIIHDMRFIETLPKREIISGFGEALRLHVTGGVAFLEKFENEIDNALLGQTYSIQSIINSSLAIKKAVVEEDEFEISLRRSMNYGHSIGHALEAMTLFAFPHGMAVTLGCMVENIIAEKLYGLPKESMMRVNECARKLVDAEAMAAVREMSLANINNILKKDKKTIGNTLKLAVPQTIGNMHFHDFILNDDVETTIKDAILAL